MLHIKKSSGQGTSMRLSANGRSLLIHHRNWFGSGPEKIREIPLASICDYEFGQDQKLALYIFEPAHSVAEWKRVKKLKSIDTAGMDGTTRQLMLARIKEMVRTNQQLGVRKQRSYYMTLPVNLEFG